MTDWKMCLAKRIAKEVKPDEGLIKSLATSSKNKMESGESLKMNGITAGSKLSLAYDSLRELLEALAVKKGYKIYNHECYTAFLKEIMGESAKGDDFDEIRKIRNAVNYYGKDISAEEAVSVIGKIKTLRNAILKILSGQPVS